MKRLARLIFLLLMSGGSATAQNQYVSIIDYRTLAVNPVAYTPGVSWVNNDNSAFDVNHQRFFFQGGAAPRPPWNLYTVDVGTGAVLSNAPVPSNNLQAAVSGLQYDNSVDTLYAIYSDGSVAGSYFAWIEISTGIAHPKQLISGYAGYLGSTYDTKDHLYIVYGGLALITIDARTGYTVYSTTFPANAGGGGIFSLDYDNSDSRLYGLQEAGAGPVQFDSFSLSTGQFHPLATMPVQAFSDLVHPHTIDEAAGNYVFVGSIPSATNCVHYRLYTVNIATATIIDSSLFPYAEDPSNPLDSNLLGFTFDNQRGRLYALNWRPTLQSVPAFIAISAASNPACAGQPEQFSATLSSPVIVNSYQWQVNGQLAGGNTPVYTDNSPADGDSIRCILTASTSCGSAITDTSSAIVLSVRPVVQSSLGITSSASNICSGDTVVFQAAPVNGGDNPQFQWQINGVAAGGSSETFSTHSLADGDRIDCIMDGSLACSSPVTSANVVVMTVRPAPGLEMPGDTVIARGQEVKLSPAVRGIIAGYQWQPATGLDNPVSADPIASPLNTTIYGLKVTADDGCSVSGKMTISVFTKLAMPGAFSPNGDGRNDVFRIPPSVSIRLSRFSIFDRLGQEVFTTRDAGAAWDGSVGGRRAPAGAYVWVVEYTDPFNGKRILDDGIVLLVR